MAFTVTLSITNRSNEIIEIVGSEMFEDHEEFIEWLGLECDRSRHKLNQGQQFQAEHLKSQ